MNTTLKKETDTSTLRYSMDENFLIDVKKAIFNSKKNQKETRQNKKKKQKQGIFIIMTSILDRTS